MVATAGALAALERRLAGARLWGLELEPRWRVLAATVEPADAGAGAPGGGPPGDGSPGGDGQAPEPDGRLQLLLYPVATFAARLTREPAVVERFDVELLPDVVAALDGPRLGERLFDTGTRRRPVWGGAVSVEGSSNAPDGRAHTVRLAVSSEERSFELEATFDDVRLRTPDGRDLPLDG